MRVARFFRHLVLPDWWVSRVFPKASLRAIEQAINRSEQRHRGELRFVAESSLPLSSLLNHETTRVRAVELFAHYGVWDTELNSGVLIYIQLIDRRVEIVADRGINARVNENFWVEVCQRMEVAFRSGDFVGGVLEAIDEISEILSLHFPPTNGNPNELPNTPVMI